jgi:hypothetical protein
MSRGVVTVGAGVLSFASTIGLTYMAHDLLAIPVAGVAAGAIGLLARKACLEEQKNLDKKDWILIGGAALTGALAGGATMIMVATVVSGVYVGSYVGSMAGSLFGTVLGNIIIFPLNMISLLARRREVHYHTTIAYTTSHFQPTL